MKVNMHEAKTKLSQLGKAVHEGEKVVIAKDGQPYLELIPYQEPKQLEPRKLGGYHISIAPDCFDEDPDLIALFEGRAE